MYIIKKQELPLLLPSIPHIQFQESLISPIQISRINLLPHIIQTAVIPVSDDRLTHLFELLQIIYHTASKEGAAIFQRWFIDHDLCAFCFDPFHDTLNRGLTEIIGIGLHGQSVYANHDFLFHRGIIIIILAIIIISRHLQYTVCDEILPCPVRLHNGRHHILRNICIIRQQLFRILWQTISTITERWIIIMRTDPRVQTHSVDDLLRVQPFHLRISVQLIKIRNTKRQICIGKQLDRFRLCKSHDQRIDIFLNSAFL